MAKSLTKIPAARTIASSMLGTGKALNFSQSLRSFVDIPLVCSCSGSVGFFSRIFVKTDVNLLTEMGMVEKKRANVKSFASLLNYVYLCLFFQM